MRRSNPVPVPSPWGGINTREGVASLKPNEARELVNWDPVGQSCRPRKGCLPSSTGGPTGHAVETLAAYQGLSGAALIGVSNGSVYDFSGSTASLLSAAGYVQSRFSTECYNNYLIAVNGVDTPWNYNGSVVGATGFSGSGLTLSHLQTVKKVRNRLWFTESNSADVWYGGLGSITGTLTKFQLSQVVGGGTCVAVAAHSQDSGSGPDDYTVFVMSTGEVVMYLGDPSTTFAKVGNFNMPPPVGTDCTTNVGGELVVLTRMGLVPMSSVVSGGLYSGVGGGNIDFLATGNFGKVGPSIKRDVDQYSSNEGWMVRTSGGQVIINVPRLDGALSYQWVLDAVTGSWTQWQGYNGASFCEYQGSIYFGLWTTGDVWRVSGTDDNGEPIAVKARCAFTTDPNGHQIEATAIRFDMTVNGNLSGAFGIDTDYVPRSITTPYVDIALSTVTTPWGSAWGSAWSSTNQYRGQWFSTFGRGRSIGPALEATVSAESLEWFGTQLLVHPVGPL